MIELKDLQKVWDQHLVIDIEALEINAGEIAAIVGLTGSGKNTLLKLLLGQSQPTVGSVRIAGLDPARDNEELGLKVGVLWADNNLYVRQSPLANLKFYMKLLGQSQDRVMKVLARVGLVDHANSPVKKLPTGLVRRLALGRAILNDPEVLLLVEPFEGCDAASIIIINRVVREMANEGASILILANDATSLDELCDTIYHLEQGKIVASYRPEEEQQAGLPLIIPARQGDKVILVEPNEILFVVAQDERAYLQTHDSLLPTRFTVSELEQKLKPGGFFRAHRSYLVNLQYVKEVIPYTRDSYSLKLKDFQETQIPLSRMAARDLRELLGF